MTRKRHWFKDFRLKELDGGLNIRDSANDIEDKQFIKLENWNFKWNKLVNSKSLEELFNVGWNTEIQALYKTWSNEVFFVHWDKLFKDWVQIDTPTRFVAVDTVADTTAYTVTINATPFTFVSDASATEQEILDWLEAAIEVGWFNVIQWQFVIDTFWETARRWLFIDDSWSAFTINSITANLVEDNETPLPTDNRRWNISTWNDIIYLTSIDKDWTDNDRLFYFHNWVYGRLRLSTDGSVLNWWPTVHTVYQGKLILWGFIDNQNSLMHSKTSSITDPFLTLDFSGYNSGSQLIWNNSSITWFQVGENWLHVFKSDEVWFSNTEKDTGTFFDFIFNKSTTTWAINQRVVTEVEQELFYYDDITKNVRRLSYEENLITLRDTSISREIETIFEQLADDQSNATASFKYPNYKLFMRSKLSWTNVNDVALVYNVDRKSWAIETEKLCSVSHKGLLWSSFEWVIFEDDEWVGTIGEAISKEFDFGDAIDFERFWEIEVWWAMDETITLFVDFFVWGELKRTVQINTKWNQTWTLWTKTLWTSILGGDFATIWLIPFAERINLYFDWQNCNFWLRYEWLWQIEIHDVHIQHKRLKWFRIYS